MTGQTNTSESHHPNGDQETGSGPGWWLVVLTSGICVAGAAVAIVLTLLF